jgi:succinyl-CoA synthetase beta subunit
MPPPNSEQALLASLVLAIKTPLGVLILLRLQTDAKGLPVNQLLIEAGKNIKQELYLGLLVDRQTQKITVLASLEGGMDIE